eukprot:scaffold254312_cov21-Prasinocladus_malaysianus.AAC.1
MADRVLCWQEEQLMDRIAGLEQQLCEATGVTTQELHEVGVNTAFNKAAPSRPCSILSVIFIHVLCVTKPTTAAFIMILLAI